MVDMYLAKGLIYLQLPNNGGIGCVIRTVDQSIPLTFKNNIGTVALETAVLGTTALGTTALGTAALGTVALGTVALGNMALGKSFINYPL